MRGLDPEDLKLVRAELDRHKEIHKAVLFGSRAKRSAQQNSDIDLALEGVGDTLTLEAIAMALDELPLLYKFDVQALDEIKNPALKSPIERVGIEIFCKS